MSGTRDRQELRQPLHYAQENGLDQFKHDVRILWCLGRNADIVLGVRCRCIPQMAYYCWFNGPVPLLRPRCGPKCLTSLSAKALACLFCPGVDETLSNHAFRATYCLPRARRNLYGVISRIVCQPRLAFGVHGELPINRVGPHLFERLSVEEHPLRRTPFSRRRSTCREP